MITIITSTIRSGSPDLQLLQNFEQFCVRNSNWKVKKGPVLFSPKSISSRYYTAWNTLLKPLLKKYKLEGAIVSLGLPYADDLYGKTFPYFSIDCDLRVLWTYDVWEPDYNRIEQLVRQSHVHLLLLSSQRAFEHFRSLQLPDCEVDWVPETINTADYHFKPWQQRSTNLLSFGRSYLDYHEAILSGCERNNIEYTYQERNKEKDVAIQGLRSQLQFPTWHDFTRGLANSQLCICFPRSMTHPLQAGNVSTLTVRYLQAMASKCLIIGAAPLEISYLLNYNPVVEVNWKNPVKQILDILRDPEPWQQLIEKNYTTVCEKFHHQNALDQMDKLITRKLVER